jgi:hypothetical protein
MKNNHKEHAPSYATLQGYSLAAHWFALIFLYPIDTATTRMRTYPFPIFRPSFYETISHCRHSISMNHEYLGCKPLLKSFMNKGFWWSGAYMTLCSATPALQTSLQRKLVMENYNANEMDHTKAFAAWIISFIQLMVLHPIDTMKVRIQQGQINDINPYLRHNARELTKGCLPVAAGSISHYIGWRLKLSAYRYLRENNYTEKQSIFLSALLFSIAHISISFPCNTVKTILQSDSSIPVTSSYVDRIQKSTSILMHHLKQTGLRALYRGYFTRGAGHMSNFIFFTMIYDNFSKNMEGTPCRPKA